jgi:iron complex transport system substrate-binding protein
MRRSLALALCALAVVDARAELRVLDDSGATVILKAPARRIVSLAPNVTEMLFAAGAGDRIVGTVDHADYPSAARAIPRVGGATLLDVERIVSLEPDVIVAWQHGTPEAHIEQLRRLGIPIFFHRAERLAQIPASLARLGELAGTPRAARAAADAFASRLGELEARYARRPPVALFFQVWSRPLLTVNADQIISDVIRLCGGRNIFEGEKLLVPTVEIEAVVRAAPQAIVATGRQEEAGDAFALWRRLPDFGPTARGNLILLDTETLGRAAPRILDGAAILCDALQGVRRRAGEGAS